MSKTHILIFRTYLQHRNEVNKLAKIFERYSFIKDWSVDLDDWEKVLRVKCVGISSDEMVELLQQASIKVEEMPT